MKHLLKTIFGNKKVVGVLTTIWAIIILPYYLVTSTITGILFMYGILHDQIITMFGRRDRANIIGTFGEICEDLTDYYDEIDEEKNLFDLYE